MVPLRRMSDEALDLPVLAADSPGAAGDIVEAFEDDPVSAALAALVRNLASGERLPSERDLAASLKVSRTALGDRLSVLEALGVLRRRSGSGTYVQDLDSASLTLALSLAISASRLSLSALHSVRRALERQAAFEAATLAEPVPIAHMLKAVKTMQSSNDPAEVDNADLAFHSALLHAADNPALNFFADALSGVLRQSLAQRRKRMRRLPDDREVMIELHLAVYEAVHSGDAVAAMRAIDHHFQAFDYLLESLEYGVVGPRPGRG